MSIVNIDFNDLIAKVVGKPGPGSGAMPPGKFNRYNIRMHLWPDEGRVAERTNEQVIDILEDKFDKAVDEQLFYQVINILEDMGYVEYTLHDKAVDEQLFYQVINILEDMGYVEYTLHDEMGDQIMFEIDQEIRNNIMAVAEQKLKGD